MCLMDHMDAVSKRVLYFFQEKYRARGYEIQTNVHGTGIVQKGLYERRPSVPLSLLDGSHGEEEVMRVIVTKSMNEEAKACVNMKVSSRPEDRVVQIDVEFEEEWQLVRIKIVSWNRPLRHYIVMNHGGEDAEGATIQLPSTACLVTPETFEELVAFATKHQ